MEDNIEILKLFSTEALVKELERKGFIVKLLEPFSFEAIAHQMRMV